MVMTKNSLFHIKAQYIGPIMDLDSSLSGKRQNLIFATNGTGKSFLARSLRMLDQSAFDTMNESEIPDSLVSEESKLGSFSLLKGSNTLGQLDLNTQNKTVVRSEPDDLFHVFSTDYIDTELRNKKYELDGEIDREIIVGKDNVELDSKREQVSKISAEIDTKKSDLSSKFLSGRNDIKKNYKISSHLKAYKLLVPDHFFDNEFEVDNSLNYEASIAKYEKFKTIPESPQVPENTNFAPIWFDLTDLYTALSEVVSTSDVAEDIKERIRTDPSFFEKGLQKYQQEQSDCPFCTQSLTEIGLKAIESYNAYFADREAQSLKQLSNLKSDLENKLKLIGSLIDKSKISALRYSELKAYFPSLDDTDLKSYEDSASVLVGVYEKLLATIDEKKENLQKSITVTEVLDLNIIKDDFEKTSNTNNELIQTLTKIIENSDTDRKEIQGRICAAYQHSFFTKYETEFRDIYTREGELKQLEKEIQAVEKKGSDKISARKKVADTFTQLLKVMFGEKYTFDEQKFTVQRNHQDMSRGGDRTLSDGEKSVIAFCYFLAQTHLKISSVADYKKLFYVIDDPVSSLSFDYIFSIAQCLKTLRVSEDDIYFSEADGMKPQMLILTHNEYFYNVINSNNVIHKSAIFQLKSNGSRHILETQKGFVSPHIFHLEHCYCVSRNKIQPTYSTPNSIRTILEGVWKFCRPDLQNLPEFCEHLNKDHNIEVKSLLLNGLSHGGNFHDQSYLKDDIEKAALEVISIVEKFAPGQIAQLNP